jgi:PadR family transcriptional regulator PadR
MTQSQKQSLELLQGTLDLMILQTLIWGPQHGYGVGQIIRVQTRDVLQVDTGSLYPALHRLEKKKWIASEWKLTEKNQRAKFYKLTTAGRKQLASERTRWEQFSQAIAAILNPERSEE